MIYIQRMGAQMYIRGDGLNIVCQPHGPQQWRSPTGFIIRDYGAYLNVRSGTGSWTAYPSSTGGFWILQGGGITPPPDPADSTFKWPYNPAKIGSEWGYRVPPTTGVGYFHSGCDWASAAGASVGTLIPCAGTGTVSMVVDKNTAGNPGGKSWGNRVLVDHGVIAGQQLYTAYAHMQDGSFQVSVGDEVIASDPLGKIGKTGSATGNHLHFVTFQGGLALGSSESNPRNTINPRTFMSLYNPDGNIV